MERWPPGALNSLNYSKRTTPGFCPARASRASRVCGELKLKDRTFVKRGGGPDPALMARDDRMADRKTHSHAFCLRSHERLEEVDVRQINSGAGILDRHIHHTRLGEARSEAKHTSLLAVHRLNRILDQVDENLL